MFPIGGLSCTLVTERTSLLDSVITDRESGLKGTIVLMGLELGPDTVDTIDHLSGILMGLIHHTRFVVEMFGNQVFLTDERARLDSDVVDRLDTITVQPDSERLSTARGHVTGCGLRQEMDNVA